MAYNLPRHTAKICRCSVCCLICEKRLFVILRPELPLKNADTFLKESSNTQDTSAFFNQQSLTGVIYLKTLTEHIRNKGKTRSARALLDDGSHRLLLGANVFGKISTGRIEVLKSGISAIETKHGWCVLGSRKKNRSITIASLNLQNFTVPDMRDLEFLDVSDPIEGKSTTLLEEEILTHFRGSIKVSKDQRYEVALPWLPSINL
ncbi:uncharacterized protein NPIL_530881 [Nephila pilipes]|uniref:Peptidase aspartic putative domain-containing protein n=1 Tax=Nephila pilipes TaxID=299642 RepID=A0A8X6PWI6_NEPPI|nr:uncharacterized protein NPIL_530881 [Nephila pilipes]